MSEEMMEDLKSSYDSFLRYDSKYEKIEINEINDIQMLMNLFTAPLNKC